MRLGGLGLTLLAFSSAAQNVFGAQTASPTLSVVTSNEQLSREGPMPYNYFGVLFANTPNVTEYVPFTPVGFFQSHQDYIADLKSNSKVAQIFDSAAVKANNSLRRPISATEFDLDTKLMQFGIVKILMQYLMDNPGLDPTDEAMQSLTNLAEQVFATLQSMSGSNQQLDSALLADKSDWYVNNGHTLTAQQRIRQFLPNIVKALAKLKLTNELCIQTATATYTATIKSMLQQKEQQVLAQLNSAVRPYAKKYRDKLPTISVQNSERVQGVYNFALYGASFPYIKQFLSPADQNITQAVSSLTNMRKPLLQLSAQAQSLILKSLSSPADKTNLMLNLVTAVRMSIDDKFASRFADQLWHATRKSPRDVDIMVAKLAMYWIRTNKDYVFAALRKIKPGAAAAKSNEQILINVFNRMSHGVERAMLDSNLPLVTAAELRAENSIATNSTKLRP